MKVIIELDQGVSITSTENEGEVCIWIKPNSSSGLVAIIDIVDLQLALRKLAAK